MADFSYRARDQNGVAVSGVIIAEDLKSAKKQISQQGLIVLSAKQSQMAGLTRKLKQTFEAGVSTDELVMFSRQMQVIYTVGIPILKGMELVLAQATNPQLKKAIANMSNDMNEGKSLHEAMSKHGNIFDPIYINLIRVGETTGGLGAMLERASMLIEERAELTAKVKSATFYPRIVIGFFMLVLIILVYGILPKLKTFFTNLGSDLPFVTRFVMGVSEFFVSYWYLIATLVVGTVWGTKKILSNPVYRMKFDLAVFRLPVLGLLFQQLEVNTFCIILDILLRSGIAIVDSLRYVESSAGNVAFARDIAACRLTVEKGGTLSQGIERAETFPVLIKLLLSDSRHFHKLLDAAFKDIECLLSKVTDNSFGCRRSHSANKA